MSALRTSTILRLVPLACLLFSARAFAQFEIAPDHFDSDRTEPLRSTDAKTKARAAAPREAQAAIEPVSAHARQLNQIAEQQAVLAGYRAQINAKREQMEAALQSLLRTGNEAGEAEALMVCQRELDKLQKSLAPAIHASEATLARLQAEMATKVQPRTGRPAKPSAL
jgi:flagellar biosynthesis/type III secretory pathway protein FliH